MTDLYSVDRVYEVKDLIDTEVDTPNNGDLLIYNSTTQKWEAASESSGLQVGESFVLGYIGSSTTNNTWLATEDDGIPSDNTPHPIAYYSELVGITFSNAKTNANGTIKIFKNGLADPANVVAILNIPDAQGAWNTTYTNVNFAPGDRLAVYFDTGTESANDVVVTLYMRITNPATGSGTF